MFAGALSPAYPSMARNTKTPASASMIVRAAARAVPAKIRSPGRTTALGARGSGVVTDTGLLSGVVLARVGAVSRRYGDPGCGPPYVHGRYFAAMAPTT